MSAQYQYNQIVDYIGIEKDLFVSPSPVCKDWSNAIRYRNDDSILSTISNVAVYRLLNRLTIGSDNDIMKRIKKATYSGKAPFRFRVVEIVTLCLTLLPIAVMLLDFLFVATNLSAFSYLYASACGLSLYITAKVAKREWMVHYWNEKE